MGSMGDGGERIVVLLMAPGLAQDAQRLKRSGRDGAGLLDGHGWGAAGPGGNVRPFRPRWGALWGVRWRVKVASAFTRLPAELRAKARRLEVLPCPFCPTCPRPRSPFSR